MHNIIINPTPNSSSQVISLKGLDHHTRNFPEIPLDNPSDDNIDTYLKEKAEFISQFNSRSLFDTGKTLSEVKTKLELKKLKNYEEWLSTINFRKSTAYKYISVYNLLNNKTEEDKTRLLKLGIKKLEFLVNKKIPLELKEQIENDLSLTVAQIKEQIKKPTKIQNKIEKFSFEIYLEKIETFFNKNKFSKIEDTTENLKKIEKIVNLLHKLE